jgi:hypothetical protein
MNTQQILQAVKGEISRLQKVVALLDEGATNHTPAATATTPLKRKAHKWTNAQRKAMSIAQKARWAAKKRKS